MAEWRDVDKAVCICFMPIHKSNHSVFPCGVASITDSIYGSLRLVWGTGRGPSETSLAPQHPRVQDNSPTSFRGKIRNLPALKQCPKQKRPLPFNCDGLKGHDLPISSLSIRLSHIFCVCPPLFLPFFWSTSHRIAAPISVDTLLDIKEKLHPIKEFHMVPGPMMFQEISLLSGPRVTSPQPVWAASAGVAALLRME